ncbi:hypothetical protein JCM14202_3856 [Agrilactobacillus composti DSM 18527 = JCM 14202]|nr:hypothetical protein JCM14202_3856 [Agrilactobacillus composti DSM 18527 = JCM 14202]
MLLTLGLGGITFGLLEGRQYGWSSLLILSSLIGGFVALGLFIGVEAKVKNPLLELDLFKEKTLSASSLVYFMTGFALVSPALIMNYFLQDVLNDTALQAALILIPVSLTIVVAMPLGTRILSAKGAIPVTFGGLVIIAGSLLALSSITTTTSKTTMVLILILNGIGFGFASVSLVASVKYLPQNKSGIGSGIVNAARQIGTCLGVAILVTTLDNHVATAKNTIRQNGIATVTKANLAPRVKNVAKNQLTQVFTTGDNAIGAKGGQSQLITAVAKAAKGTQDLPKPQGNSTTAKLYRASVRLHQGLSQVHNGSQRLTATMMGLGANPQRQAVAQQLGTASGKITAGTGQLAQKQQAFSTALQQLAQKQVLTRVFTTIKKDKNQQLSQAFSRTYLLSALIVLVISPVAFWTDRHKVKASN